MATFVQPHSADSDIRSRGSKRLKERGCNTKANTVQEGASPLLQTGSSSQVNQTQTKMAAATSLEKVKRLGIVTQKPMYPNYSRLNTRVNSFKNFPRQNAPDIRLLSEAGFAYTGSRDAVRCFYCGHGLSGWRKDMCPYVQHATQNRNCPHLINCKGREFVDDVTNGKHESQCVVSDPLEEILKKNEVAIEALNEFGISKAHCRKGIQKLVSQSDKDVFSALELLSVIEELDEEETKENHKGEDVRKPVGVASNGTDGDDDDGDVMSLEELRELEEENERLKDMSLCRICMDAIACIITLPCGHMIACPQCVPALTECAVCRTPIKGTVRARLT